MNRTSNPTSNRTTFNTPPTGTTRLCALAAALALSLGLAACGKPDEPVVSTPDTTLGQKVDGAVAATERKAEEVKADVKQATAELRQDTKDAMSAASVGITDATITAAINAKLAADRDLSALRIDVDTTAGKVALRGTAPTADAKNRATVLARTVDGVKRVDNELVVSKG